MSFLHGGYLVESCFVLPVLKRMSKQSLFRYISYLIQNCRNRPIFFSVDMDSSDKMTHSINEPRHEKANVLVSDLVRHKPGCTATEDG